jgi:SAM-dependent methyltransferase
MICRHCKKNLNHTFLDLGYAPPSNSYLSKADLKKPELYYPLKTHVCDECWLVQTEDYIDAEKLFISEYAYVSSTSSSWLEHAKNYSYEMIEKLKLNKNSYVIEIASNDGYLLKNFVKEKIPCLGIEPTTNTAVQAKKIGIPVLCEFFGESLAKKLSQNGQKADLVIGNNVYAHVPNINDFTRGLREVLKPDGTITLEFPHLMNLIQHNQFDTIYHEHFSYLSLYTVNRIFEKENLRVLDVEEINTHGGSLRVYVCHRDDSRLTKKIVKLLIDKEKKNGLQDLNTYENFQNKANKIKNDLLNFLIEQKANGKKVAAYGAAAKGNTLLNYAGIKEDLLSFICDGATAKQGKFMPGNHIPIISPENLKRIKLDYLLILPWNISDEVKKQNYNLEKNGVKFIVAVPELKIL